MRGIEHDKSNRQWIISDQWMVFFGFSAAATVISIFYGVINAIL